MVKVDEAFSKAVVSYLDAINKDFHLPQGDDIDLRPYKENINHLYRKAPTAVRASLLYFILKTMSKFGGGRLNNWCRDLAIELTEELEKI